MNGAVLQLLERPSEQQAHAQQREVHLHPAGRPCGSNKLSDVVRTGDEVLDVIELVWIVDIEEPNRRAKTDDERRFLGRQLTGALRYLPFGKQVAVVTDARFSGVSTGACIGHVSPEALAGGPIGKLRDGDLIQIAIDTHTLEGSLNFVGEGGVVTDAVTGARILERRTPRPDLAADPELPDDTRLWAALQDVSGGTWGGAVYDVDAILRVLAAGKRAQAAEP